MSSHAFIEFSSHLLAATPTCDWLEYLNKADMILAEPLVPRDGMLTAPSAPGAA